MVAIFVSGQFNEHDFWWGPSKDYVQIWFNPSRASGEDFQRIWIYHQDKVLVHIMDVGQGHHAQFWKEMIHPNIIILNLFQFGPVVLEKKKKSGKLADDSGQLTWL